jgi:RimJ/RimL family protein N-acetyltransferase
VTAGPEGGARPELPIGPPVADPRPALVPRREPYRGRWISLWPLDSERDAAALFRASHGTEEAERLWTYMWYGPFADEADMRAWLDGCAAGEDPCYFAVRDEGTGDAVGLAAYLNLVPPMRTIELGHIWYGPAHQRGVTNTEAMFLMLGEAFERCSYRRVEWKCDALNERSRRAALRLGFRFEGVFRQHLVVKGRNRDTAWFSMLDTEWPAVRSALERWLACDGGARPPLARLREEAEARAEGA